MTDDLSFTITAEGPLRASWRYLWAKHVTGFDSAHHCAKCLRGHYETRFGLTAPLGARIALTGYKHGDLIYFCGVSKPYVWEHNLHLAVRVQTGGVAGVVAVNGDRIHIDGAVPVRFDDRAALAAFPDKGKDFLTCRNFQAGADFAARGLL